MMMEKGYGIIVVERADYVLTGARSMLQAVVTLSESLRGERERERENEGKKLWLLMDDDSLHAVWGRGNRA